jgi:type II secretory pathway component PulF
MADWFPTLRPFAASPGSFRGWWPWFTTAGQRQDLLRLLIVATEENLPLAPLVEQWADDERGIQRWRLSKLAKMLRQGRPLADAVEAVPRVLREEDVLALRFDAQSGTRTAATSKLLVGPPAGTPRARRAIVYLSIFVPIAIFVIGFTQLKIVPVLGRIFQEFGIQPPPVLDWSVSRGGLLFSLWWLAALAVIAVLHWLLATRSGRPARHALFGRLIRPWHQVRSADVLQKIGIAVAAGRPISGALSTLARYHFDPAIRHELLFVRNEVEQGAEVWPSMAAVKMLSAAEVDLLRSAERMGNQPWVLEQLVEAKKRRTSQRLARLGELAVPAVVFLISGLVVFQALTVFHPLTRIIAELL